MSAFIFQSGVWVEIISKLYLYDKGKTFGYSWFDRVRNGYNISASPLGTVTNANGLLTFVSGDGNNRSCFAIQNFDPLILTKFSTLNINATSIIRHFGNVPNPCSLNAMNNNNIIHISTSWTSLGTSYNSNSIPAASSVTVSYTPGLVSIPLTSVPTTGAYIGIMCYGGTLSIDQMWLSK